MPKEGLQEGTNESSELRAREVLERIDFDVLNAIFSRQLAHAGAPMRAFSPSLIRVDPNATRSRLLPSGEIEIGARGLPSEESKFWRVELLLTVIHEMAHLFSRGTDYGDVTEHGVSLIRSEDGEPIRGEALNEGITELSAIEVARLYIAQSGDRQYFLGENTEEEMLGMHDELSYPEHVGMTAVLVGMIAKNGGVPEDVVWGALQHAYFNNTNIASKEFFDALSPSVGKEAASQLIDITAKELRDPDTHDELLRLLSGNSL